MAPGPTRNRFVTTLLGSCVMQQTATQLPSDHQWAQVFALVERLRGLSKAAWQNELRVMRGQSTYDALVLSLVFVHLSLPLEADRDRTGERIGTCTLRQLLGEGGMGVVYRAWQDVSREVAVKLIHPALIMESNTTARSRFQQEIGALASLQYSGIVRLYEGGVHTDLETHESVPYLAMELVQEGIPLTTYADDHELTVVDTLTPVLPGV